MDDVVSQIKERLDIVEFIASYLPLKRTGRNYKALCPFHQEKTPSFIVSPERQIWRCFGACQEGGDVIKFYMKWEGLSFWEAVKDLAMRLGIEIKRSFTAKSGEYSLKQSLIELNQKIAKVYEHVLWKTKEGWKARDYLLKKRKLTEGIIKSFEIGYAFSNADYLYKFLRKKGIDENLLMKTGIFYKSSGEVKDRFSGRIIFPIKNLRGEVIGFSGRLIEDRKDLAKYINIPETDLYKKRETLYGIHLTRDFIKQENLAFVVEGEFDVIKPFQYGFKNFTAIKGSAFTTEQLRLLKRITQKVVLLLDNDETGIEAAKRSLERLNEVDIELYVSQIDFAKDPDEAIETNKSLFKKKIYDYINIYDFVIEQIRSGKDLSNPYEIKRFLSELIDVLRMIKNDVIRDVYIKRFSEQLRIEEFVIKRELKKAKRKRQFFVKKEGETQKIDRELLVLGLILQAEEMVKALDQMKKILSPEDFHNPGIRDIINWLDEHREDYKNLDKEQIFLLMSPAMRELAEQAYLYPSFIEVTEDQFEKTLYFLKRDSLKLRLKLELEKQEADDDLILQLTSKIKEIESNYFKF